MENNTSSPQETRSVDLHDLYLTENNTLTSDAYKDWKEGKLDLELAKCYVHRLCHHTASFYEDLTLTRRELHAANTALKRLEESNGIYGVSPERTVDLVLSRFEWLARASSDVKTKEDE